MAILAKTVVLALAVALAASFYQVFVKDLFTVTFGVGRVIQRIEEFPYDCRRIVHPRLEACEDIWLDNEGRTLYAACAGTQDRLAWNQAMKDVNVTGRRPGGSELLALDIDNPGEDGLFNFRGIKPVGHYIGATGNRDLDLLGFDAEILDDGTTRFYFVNQRPPVGPSQAIIDASELGANSTIEIFELKKGWDEMQHIRTILSPDIWTPNRVAAIGDKSGAFLVTNDHSVKVGWRRKLDYFIGGGNVAYCSASGSCHAAYTGNEERDQTRPSASHDESTFANLMQKSWKYLAPPVALKFPNGLSRNPTTSHFHVPSAIDGKIRIFSLDPSTKKLTLVETVNVGMPLDNISPDANGDMYAAGFPNLIQSGKGFDDPYGEISPVTIWRVRKRGVEGEGRHKVEKVIEDNEGKVLSGSTTVRHDVKTGRLFVSAAVHPFLVVCEPKPEEGAGV
ncbi:hypothetical protein Ptr902_13125 [Pyrenophora tritici-repentis]|nr:hypothetical protein Ptr902_13125 [Pyrenophora tritici-repentis]